MPPPPPPPPPPMQPTDVRILTNPTPQNFASVSVSALVSGSGSDQKLTSVSNADSDQVHIRYSNGGYYEIEMPGKAWEQLGFAKGVTPTDPSTAVDFQPVSAPQNGASLDTFAAKTEGYNYWELPHGLTGAAGSAGSPSARALRWDRFRPSEPPATTGLSKAIRPDHLGRFQRLLHCRRPRVGRLELRFRQGRRLTVR